METVGYNDTEQNQSLKGLLLPSTAEVVLLLFVSFTILICLNYSSIWTLLTDSSKLTAETAGQAVQPQVEAVSNFFKQEIFGKATLFFIWACVGAIAYAIIGALQHFFWRVKEDVDASNYVKPAATKTYWYSRVSQYLYFIAIAFLFAVFVGLFFGTLLPLSVELANTTIRGFRELSNYGYFLLGLGLMMLCLYMLSRLWKAVSYSFHITFAKVDWLLASLAGEA